MGEIGERKERRGAVRWRVGGDPCPSNLDFQLIGSEIRAEDEKRNCSYFKISKVSQPALYLLLSDVSKIFKKSTSFN